MANWRDAIELKIKRFNELEGLLADSEVIANTALYQRYAKEHASLAQVVKAYTAYADAERETAETEKIIAEEKSSEEMRTLAKDELRQLKQKLDERYSEIEDLLLAGAANFDKNAIVEIRAGTGGLEASLFAADLFRMYSKYAAGKNWQTETLSTNMTDQGGYKEVIFSVSGTDVYGRMRFESGTHRVQRIPQTEASGRIHTSAVTVAVLPEAEEVDVKISNEDIRIDVFKSSGKGGQGVNTTDSAVRITHLPTNIVVSCQDERSQLKNKNKAMRVLRTRLLEVEEKKKEEEISTTRKIQVGSGDRSQKIRTYNFPERRVTDHRINLTLHRLESILEGDLDILFDALLEEDKKIRLEKQ